MTDRKFTTYVDNDGIYLTIQSGAAQWEYLLELDEACAMRDVLAAGIDQAAGRLRESIDGINDAA
jgi:hypothetical protein